jgi:hypothetical protein
MLSTFRINLTPYFLAVKMEPSPSYKTQFRRIQGVTPQKTIIFIFTAVIT